MRQGYVYSKCLFVLLGIIIFLITFSSSQVVFGQSPESSSAAKPLKQFLNEDGSIDMVSNFSGNLDPTGYRMINGPDGTPRFVPIDAIQKTTASDPDDVYWDDRFGNPANLNNLVYAIAVSDSGIYIGGEFTDVGGDTTADYIVRWDGSDWSSVGGGVNSTVYAILLSGGNIYVGGVFMDAGGNVNADHIAFWNGTSWNSLGSGAGGTVRAIAVSGSNVYVGGNFSSAGGVVNTRGVARWDGSNWNSLGTGLNGVPLPPPLPGEWPPVVYAIAISGSNIYVGGDYLDAGGNVNADRIARFSGFFWQAMGGGASGAVHSIAIDGSDIYIGGNFSDIGGDPNADRIARWDGSSWNALGSGLSSTVNSIALIPNGLGGNDVYAGGSFSNAGGDPDADYIARWDGANWNVVGSGITYHIFAVAGSPNGEGSYDLYIGGMFTNLDGNASMDYITRWDGSMWNALGSGLSELVRSVGVGPNGTGGSNVYVGGNFTDASGDANADYIAYWDGSKWNSLGVGLNSGVRTLAVSPNGSGGSDVYAGGGFINAGGEAAADYIARWDGSSWNALGSGANGIVWAVAVCGSDVYIGGSFTSVGGVTSTSRIARWDGATWHAMGTGLSNTVYAIAIGPNGSGGINVYAGGDFLNAGGDANADRIACWNGSNWIAMGTGVTSTVRTIAVSGTDVYAGGLFTSASGVASTLRIARWNGSSWNAVGSGLGNSVFSIVVNGSEVYAGGQFLNAGGIENADRIARWDGSSWNALGSGVLGYIYGMAIDGKTLCVGGDIASIGDKSVYNYAMWSKPTSSAGVTKGFTTPTSGTVSFNEAENVTAVHMDISSSSGSATVVVNRYNDSPTNVSGIIGNVSQYRWIIQQTGLAPSFNASVRFRVSEIPSSGISDPNLVVVYSRPSPGTGAFTALITTYDGINGDIVASNVSSFSEFVFESSDPLPVEIAGFSAVSAGPSVEISWRTESETDNYGFDIERRTIKSSSSEEWAKIGFVEGAGTSSTQKEYSFTDCTVEPGRYVYRLKQIDQDGLFKYSQSVEVEVQGVPRVFALKQNYPNPFNPITTIEFTVGTYNYTSLRVYDLLGREVAVLVDEELPAGILHKATFDASKLSSGIYLYRLQAGNNVQVKKLILMK